MYTFIGGIMVITFLGHSDYIYCLEDEEQLLNLIEKVAKDNQVDFYLGGYGNFDNFALKCATIYKSSHPNAKLVFVTPYLNNWLDKRKEVIYKYYDLIIFPEIENTPKKFAILKRNEWMINKADYVFAYVKNSFGGAYKTLLYAYKHKKPFTNLYNGNLKLF